MAGFYGNIRNSTSNSFKFDRVFSNRKIMDAGIKNGQDDGVFGGRYVLVEYDNPLGTDTESPIVRKYYKLDDSYYGEDLKVIKEINEIESIEEGVISYAIRPKDGDMALDEISGSNGYITLVIEKEIVYEQPENEIYEPEGEYWRNTDDNLLYDAQYSFNKDREVIVKTKTPYAYNNERKIDNIEEIGEPLPDEIQPEDDWYTVDWYTVNYIIDKDEYGNGRGYDSTVWRKVYKQDGTAQYVNVAELNSVVPTFAVSADAPSDSPVKPHFDADSTNVYYNLHLQTPWGFRVTPIESDEVKSEWLELEGKSKWEGLSDYRATYINKSIDDHGNFSIKEINYPAAIYFNKAGFDSNTHNKTNFAYDESTIEINNSGTTDLAQYNQHTNEHGAEKVKAYDIKELSIMLPALGDTVAEMWDLMYGDGSNNNGSRIKTIHWDDPNYPVIGKRLRLVTDKNDGYYYTPLTDNDIYGEVGERQIDTLAGAINSVHDLMGMIITKETPTELEDGNLAEVEGDDDHYFKNALNKYIYYDTNEDDTNDFYYAGNSYGYLPLENDENNFNFVKNYSGYKPIPNGLSLEDYGKVVDKRYIKINNHTLKLDNHDIATAGAEYFIKPDRLRYAGSLIETSPDEYYYIENNAISVEENRTTPGFEKTKMRYVITADTERQEDKRYYVLEDGIYGEYFDELVNGETYYEEENLLYYSIKDANQKICYNVDATKEYYVPELKDKYYIYDDYTNKYVSLLQLEIEKGGWNGLQDEEILPLWTQLASEHRLFRDGEFGAGDYHIYSQGNWSIERTKKQTSTGDITYEYFVLNGNATSLLELKRLVQDKITELSAVTPPAGSTYTYDENTIFKTGEPETIWVIDPDTGKKTETSTKDHTGIPIYKFLFDNQDLYEELDGNIVQSGFKYSSSRWNSAKEDITEASSNKKPFKKIYLNPVSKYENGKYWIFESNDKQLIENPHMVFVGNSLQSVKTLSSGDGYINTDDQDINILQLSTNGYSPDYDYWMMTDAQGRAFTKEQNLQFLNNTKAYGINDLYTALYENDAISPNKFYYADDVLYVQNEDGSYELSKKDYNYTGEEPLYTERKLFIIDVGSFDDYFNLYQEWNPQVIQSEDDWREFFDATTHPDDPNWKPLVLGKKVNVLVRKELPGFARDLNTMHGLLLRINEILQAGNIKTRDPNTVQGCLNQLHDIFEKFDELIPGELYGVNMFGQISPVGFNSNDGGESWITLQTHSIDDDADPDYGKTVLEVIHDTNLFADDRIYTLVEEANYDNNETYYINDNGVYREYQGDSWIDGLYEQTLRDPSNHDIFEISKSGDTVAVTEPVIDNAGHVVGSKETSITLPLNFSSISVTGTSAAVTAVTGAAGSITPDNSADNLSILSGNKWVVMAPVDNTTDSLTIGHSLNGINAVKAVGDTAAQTPSFGATFKALDAKIDEAGHVTKLDEHTVKIPQGSLTQTANKNVVTKLAFVPSTGAITSTRMDLAEIALGGAGGYSTSPEIGNTTTLGNAIKTITDYVNQGAENIFLNNFNDYYPDGESMGQNVDNNDNINEAIAKLQWQMDDHKQNQLGVVNGSSNTADVISGLTFDTSTGKITATKTTLSSGLLTGYTLGSDSTAIAATDTIGQAMSKLQNNINTIYENMAQTNTNITNNYCGIIRQPNTGGTNVPHAGDGVTGHSEIKTGWLWVDTLNHYVYINTGNINTESGNLTDAYGWELLNAWQ